MHDLRWKYSPNLLYTWVERGTGRVKCLAQEHNTMSPAMARARTVRPGVKRNRNRKKDLLFENGKIEDLSWSSFQINSWCQIVSFQFKINHNILYTKSRLYRDKITENDKCYLCSGSQTLVHLFADCVFSKIFWTDFTSWWNCKNNTQIRLQQRDIQYAFHSGKCPF